MMNWWDFIPWFIGIFTLGTWTGKFLRWCWFIGKGKIDLKKESEQLKIYKEYYDSRKAYFDPWGMQNAYNTPEWDRIEKAEEAILEIGRKNEYSKTL